MERYNYTKERAYVRFLLISLQKGYFDIHSPNNHFETYYQAEELLFTRLYKLKHFYWTRILHNEPNDINYTEEELIRLKFPILKEFYKSELLLIYYFISLNKKEKNKQTHSDKDANELERISKTGSQMDINTKTDYVSVLLNIFTHIKELNETTLSDINKLEVKIVERLLQSITLIERSKENLNTIISPSFKVDSFSAKTLAQLYDDILTLISTLSKLTYRLTLTALGKTANEPNDNSPSDHEKEEDQQKVSEEEMIGKLKELAEYLVDESRRLLSNIKLENFLFSKL